MGRHPVSDEVLQRAYAGLLAARQKAVDPPAVDIETVQALAAGTYLGGDRMELLDRVLAHPLSAAELFFFRDLAATAPATAGGRRLPAAWLALAAAVVLGVGAVSLWRQEHRGESEALRGGGAGFAVIEPVPDQEVGPGTRFVWRSTAGATEYRLELADSEANLAFSVGTRDTVSVLPDTVRLVSGAAYLARVIATLRDGTLERTPAARFTAR